MADSSLHKRLLDLGAALPLILFNALAIWGLSFNFLELYSQRTFASRLLLSSEISTSLFLALQIWLLCTRPVPIAKASGWRARAIALAASNCAYLLVLVPRASLPQPLALSAIAITVIGTIGAVVTLAFLGGSFSILPQARGLVTNGPYRIVRHPLYAFEQLATLGVALGFMQPAALVIFLVTFALQWPRMLYEESVLNASFPAYRAYAAGMPRIIPRLLKRRDPAA